MYRSWWPVSSKQLCGFVSWKSDATSLLPKLPIILLILPLAATKYNQTLAKMLHHFGAMGLW